MTYPIDPAILRSLQPTFDDSATLTHLDMSDFTVHRAIPPETSTYRLTNAQTSLFIKTWSAPDAAARFESEHASLNAIHDVVPSLCPRSLAWGELDEGGYFIATEFVEVIYDNHQHCRRYDLPLNIGLSLAQKVAQLHSAPAPIPEGYDIPMFGFPVTTYCNQTPQPNTFKASWADFFAENRLLMILKRVEENRGKDAKLRKVVQRTVREVVPRLLGDGHLGGENGISPVVVHGNLFGWNAVIGVFTGLGGSDSDAKGPLEELLFDPSVVYGHIEYDLGMRRLFSPGFGSGYCQEYDEIVPKTEPVEEYEDRVALYESYHLLRYNDRAGAMHRLGCLLKKYGNS